MLLSATMSFVPPEALLEVFERSCHGEETPCTVFGGK